MKTAVIYWSGTGNTEAMAKAVAEGAGAECFAVSEFSGNAKDSRTPDDSEKNPAKRTS